MSGEANVSEAELKARRLVKMSRTERLKRARMFMRARAGSQMGCGKNTHTPPELKKARQRVRNKIAKASRRRNRGNK